MKVYVIPCGPTANASEEDAIDHLKRHLEAEPGSDQWFLLTNLAFSVTHRMQSDEIDIIAIGPPGVRVIEVKHWSSEWISERRFDLEHEADLVTGKSKKVGTTLRKELRDLPHVGAVFFLTQEVSKLKRFAGESIRGVPLYTRNSWKEIVGLGEPRALDSQGVRRLSQILEPRSRIAVDGDVRRFAGYVNLELQSPKEERFHRIYKGSHSTRRDRVVLHLYDLSATDAKNAGAKARREFDTLHRLQLHNWAPRVLDSFQDAPGYPGEMCFFTVVDPAAPSISSRSDDRSWANISRLEFVRNALKALGEFHGVHPDGEVMIHRNLTPSTILVKHDNSPLLTGFDRTRIPTDVSIASGFAKAAFDCGTAAPEVIASGLAAADCRSDVYSLCAALSVLFQTEDDPDHRRAREILDLGKAAIPANRATLDDLHARFGELLGASQPRPAVPPARFWTEGQVVEFHDRDYRIVNRLGSGGFGTAYKVIEVDRTTKEDLGTYVAKIVFNEDRGKQTLRAYALARSHVPRYPGLSTIFEIANEWQDNGFITLMAWVEGTPLAEFSGVFPLLADDLQEESSSDLAIRWIKSVCLALDTLHRNGLVHGDVSPRNLIVSGNDLVLTDFDFVAKIGETSVGIGTAMYSAPTDGGVRLARPDDDIYALASSLFQVVYDREPFKFSGQYEKARGLNWEGIDENAHPLFNQFLRRATHPDPASRFASVEDVRAFLKQAPRPLSQPDVGFQAETLLTAGPSAASATELREEHVLWLRDVLRAYPGYPGGNQETRGLDSGFANSTYVETTLERTLLRDIRERRVRLVVLCGNAGDGKTALLQHIAQQLGLGKHCSADRVLQGIAKDGPTIRMNLDGSAAWKGRSADELLDEFLEPFQNGEPTEDIVHLLAINDGRLLEWIDGYEDRHSNQASVLTSSLMKLLHAGASQTLGRVRFISLNQRSLVGDVSADRQEITTEFLERLLDQLYGASETKLNWSPCRVCSAQSRCKVFQAGRLFAPDGFPSQESDARRQRARKRLAEALQSVHLRGEIHITVRELRAALVYILFGVNFCDDYHAGNGAGAWPYWDRVFCADSPARQGDLLRELVRFDPALESHPQIDRHLTGEPVADAPPSAPRYPKLCLSSGRRRAYFEWNEREVVDIGGSQEALDLARGRHLRKFRELPLCGDPVRQGMCAELCRGISMLEDLPPKALERENVVPLRVTPRTPTETAFWVEKPLSRFRLEPTLPLPTEGIERLHRQAKLIYRYRDGHEETLRIGAELFHLLLELARGYQLGDVSTDDTFANLSIFVQRLVQEDARELLVWNPMADETIYQVTASHEQTESLERQYLSISPIATGGKP